MGTSSSVSPGTTRRCRTSPCWPWRQPRASRNSSIAPSYASATAVLAEATALGHARVSRVCDHPFALASGQMGQRLEVQRVVIDRYGKKGGDVWGGTTIVSHEGRPRSPTVFRAGKG